jgi:hypothetical protein
MRASTVSALAVSLAALFLFSCAAVPPVPQTASGIEGWVAMKDGGQPAAGAYVYVYRDMTKNLVGVSDFTSGPADGKGAYRLELPPGRYGVVARRRASGEKFAPIATGDEYDNRPGMGMVEVRPGAFTRVDFALITMREPMFFKRGHENVGDTGVRGRITDEKGAPVGGAFAIAYAGSDMKRLPRFASMISGSDGRYVLYLPAGGRYWLGARVHVKDAPVPGEPYAVFEGSPDHSCEVTQGRFTEGIELVLRPFKGAYKPGRVLY